MTSASRRGHQLVKLTHEKKSSISITGHPKRVDSWVAIVDFPAPAGPSTPTSRIPGTTARMTTARISSRSSSETVTPPASHDLRVAGSTLVALVDATVMTVAAAATLVAIGVCVCALFVKERSAPESREAGHE